MLQNIIVKKEEFIKKGSRWILSETEINTRNVQFVQNIIDAKGFFKSLGGYERHDKNYTRHGYRVIRVSSISPDRTKKVVYNFDFSNAEY